MEFKRVVINKNRGWRGLAEINCLDSENDQILNMIFSFSQDVWDDLMDYNKIVVQDDTYYYILTLKHDDAYRLPHDHQRSVLIKNFVGGVDGVDVYKKTEWSNAMGSDWAILRHFILNNNNHTTSDWNCIGIRVVPEI